MADRKESLIIIVGILRDNQRQFKNKGELSFSCPKCSMPIKVKLRGLPEDLSLSPEVDILHEWHPEVPIDKF